MFPRLIGSFAALFAITSATQAAAPDATGLAFFEQKIRPVLVEKCYSCHSADTKKGAKGGLRVDTREALLRGGDGGAAVVPGKRTESLLLKALRGDEVAEMPPSGKLPEAVIADFEKWIAMGAPDPRDGKFSAASGFDITEGRKFWSFQPPKVHSAPAVTDSRWVRTDIDRFLLAALESKKLTPSRDADRRTLIRRLTVDLHGLFPTPQEIDAFVNDPSSDDDALTKLVDRLLASPRYGERWGRHWLDLARYADSNGKDENLTFHEAYLYRDYVIRAFTQDMPYNRFVREQIAGDLLPAATPQARDEQMIATGFLVVGPKVLADRDKEKRKMDVVDEQIDTIGKVFLGQTLGCARCHDHKFDPVPQADYYALAGIFTNTRTLDSFKLGNPIVSGWILRPIGGPDAEKVAAVRKDYDAKLKKIADEIKKGKAELATAQDQATMRQPAGLAGITVDDNAAKFVGTWKASVFSRPYVGEGYVHDDKSEKGKKSATYTPTLPRAGEYQVLVSYTPNKGRASNIPITVKYDGGEKTVTLDETQAPKVDGLFQPIGTFRFVAGNQGSVTIGTTGTEGHVIADAVRFIPVGELEKVPAMAMSVPAEVKKRLADTQGRLTKLEAEEAAMKKAAPPAPKLAMAVRDEDIIADAKINVRGNPHQLGATIPRGFLQAATFTKMPTLPANQSGRKELAEWLASAENPLTARVWVNRVWSHLFGEGIVRSVDNFGRQGEKPSHPELLDTLAVNFMRTGWSTKKLVREIVLSRAYRTSTVASAELVKADPENRLFGHANRRRVEAEVIRDAILQTSGAIDLTPGGAVVSHLGERAIDNESKGGIDSDANPKRSVFLPVIRNDLPAILEVFDFADHDVATGKRDTTTVPTQALYLMNATFPNAQATATAKRLLSEFPDDRARLKDLFARSLGRAPTAAELERMTKFLAGYKERLASVGTEKSPKNPTEAAWSALCLSVFGCTEFRFVE